MTIYHVTTDKKAKRYRESGCIHRPVRGFTTLQAAMAWGMKVGRKVIYRVESGDASAYKLPDHHNEFGEAWWIDADIPIEQIACVFSADGDA